MKASEKHKFGRTDLEVTALGFGGGPIGNQARPVSEQEVEAIVDAAWDTGIRYFDTSPFYGHGLSEARLGHCLRWRPREDYVLSTKVGRLLKPRRREEIDFGMWVDGLPNILEFDYSYDGVMRSFEDSLQRLGLQYIDILWIHDCDKFSHAPDQQKRYFRQAMDSAFPALEQLRSQGLVKSIGLGVNEWEVCHQALVEHDFDSFLLAGRYTLLEQEALDKFLPLCEERNVAVALGGGFNSGILAKGAVPGAKYNYGPAPDGIMARVRRIEAVCASHDVSLPAAALQFVLAHPCIPTVPAGVRSAGQLRQNAAWIEQPIPAAFWTELKADGLLRQDAPTPD